MTLKWKLTLIIGAFILANSTIILAQCPEQGIPVLETPEMVDSFLAIYPNCEYIEGSLKIDNVRIYWVKEEVGKYLVTLGGILIAIIIGLRILFEKIAYFKK